MEHAMGYDPRLLMHAMEDICEELNRWATVATDARESASFQQRQARELVDRSMHRAMVTLDHATEDEERATAVSAAVAALIDQCDAGLATANDTLAHANREHGLATSALTRWQGELAKALRWLERARARLARALRELEAAQRALDAALHELDAADRAYRSCMNNPKRQDCGGEANRVRNAQAAVYAAQTWVAGAEAEVRAAEAEVRAAEARVACCSAAVDLASSAVEHASNMPSVHSETPRTRARRPSVA
jgi:hypothetical protein